MHYVSTSSNPSGGPGKLNFYLVKSIIVGALGGLLFGFDTAVISGTTEALRELFGLGNFGLGFTVSSALIGTIDARLATMPCPSGTSWKMPSSSRQLSDGACHEPHTYSPF